MSAAEPTSLSLPAPRPRRTVLLYALFLVAGLGAFFAVRYVGEGLAEAAPVVQPEAPAAPSSSVAHLLLALAAVLLAGRLLGLVFMRFKEPPVIAEVVAGIVLGPSLLGQISPEAMRFVFPADAAPQLGALAQVGVITYLFLVGLELNTAPFRQHVQSTAFIAHVSMIVPFLGGAILALLLFPGFAPSGVSFTPFALFLGVSLAVTAFPVLARILSDLRLTQTPLGALALLTAAIDDISAWTLLALVVGIVQADASGAGAVMLYSLLFLAFMVLFARPAVAWFTLLYEAREDLRPRLLPWVFVPLLLAALATEAIGIHALFGAFLLGALVPHESKLTEDLTQRLELPVTGLLLPAFFAYTGLRTQIGLVQGTEAWLICGLIILVAAAGKIGGAYVAGRLTGLGHSTSLGLGILVNTRGLMELIVLNVGLEMGILSPRLFAMLVLMALVTTLMTAPLLSFLAKPHAKKNLASGDTVG
ncbi:MAG: cation:proton antiporter [Gemmataceae bacterium]